MKQTFPKEEKLKQHRHITQLFAEGQSIKKFPIKLLYYPLSDTKLHKVGVSVPKRHFKRAVDRNRLKRQLRESYRLNKKEQNQDLSGYALMFIYMDKEKRDFDTIFTSVQKLLDEFYKRIN